MHGAASGGFEIPAVWVTWAMQTGLIVGELEMRERIAWPATMQGTVSWSAGWLVGWLVGLNWPGRLRIEANGAP